MKTELITQFVTLYLFQVQANNIPDSALLSCVLLVVLAGGGEGELRAVEHLPRRLPPPQLREVCHLCGEGTSPIHAMVEC